MKPVFVNGVARAPYGGSLAPAIREVIVKASDNFSWLETGDLVLLKPALNSGDPYPSTTHSLAIQTVSKLLVENGARVVIGD
jgi:uncharacterized protein (DUF362 family)